MWLVPCQKGWQQCRWKEIQKSRGEAILYYHPWWNAWALCPMVANLSCLLSGDVDWQQRSGKGGGNVGCEEEGGRALSPWVVLLWGGSCGHAVVKQAVVPTKPPSQCQGVISAPGKHRFLCNCPTNLTKVLYNWDEQQITLGAGERCTSAFVASKIHQNNRNLLAQVGATSISLLLHTDPVWTHWCACFGMGWQGHLPNKLFSLWETQKS